MGIHMCCAGIQMCCLGIQLCEVQGCKKFVIWIETYPENTGHIVSDRKKLALDITISEIYLVKKGVSDVQFKLICIMIIKD